MYFCITQGKYDVAVRRCGAGQTRDTHGPLTQAGNETENFASSQMLLRKHTRTICISIVMTGVDFEVRQLIADTTPRLS